MAVVWARDEPTSVALVLAWTYGKRAGQVSRQGVLDGDLQGIAVLTGSGSGAVTQKVFSSSLCWWAKSTSGRMSKCRCLLPLPEEVGPRCDRSWLYRKRRPIAAYVIYMFVRDRRAGVGKASSSERRLCVKEVALWQVGENLRAR